MNTDGPAPPRPTSGSTPRAAHRSAHGPVHARHSHPRTRPTNHRRRHDLWMSTAEPLEGRSRTRPSHGLPTMMSLTRRSALPLAWQALFRALAGGARRQTCSPDVCDTRVPHNTAASRAAEGATNAGSRARREALDGAGACQRERTDRTFSAGAGHPLEPAGKDADARQSGARRPAADAYEPRKCNVRQFHLERAIPVAGSSSQRGARWLTWQWPGFAAPTVVVACLPCA